MKGQPSGGGGWAASDSGPWAPPPFSERPGPLLLVRHQLQVIGHTWGWWRFLAICLVVDVIVYSLTWAGLALGKIFTGAG